MKNQKQNRQHHLESIKFRQGKALRRLFERKVWFFSVFSSSTKFDSSVVREICSQFLVAELMLNKNSH